VEALRRIEFVAVMEEGESRRSGGGGEICGETPRGRGTESAALFFSQLHVDVGPSGIWVGAIGRRRVWAWPQRRSVPGSGQKKHPVRGLDMNGHR
jgi:hypothetical protein